MKTNMKEILENFIGFFTLIIFLVGTAVIVDIIQLLIN